LGIIASSVSAWSPLDLSGLVAWYDASNAASITSSGGAVSQLADLSGNGYHLTQATAGAKPTTGTRTQNGLNVLDFDGGDHLRHATVPASQPLTVWVVASWDVFTAATYRLPFDSATSAAPVVFYFNAIGAAPTRFRFNAGADLQPATPVATGTPFILIATANGATSSFALNGDAAATGNAGSNNLTGITVGKDRDLDNELNGWVAEVGVAANTTAPERASLLACLNAKWAVYV
jgi:hypothetical protein